MEQINLLPESVRQRVARQRLVPYAVLAVLIGVAVVGAGWFALKANVSSLDSQVAKREQDMADSATAALSKDAQLQATKQAASSLTTRSQILNQLSIQETNWSQAFVFLGSVIPKDVTVTAASYVVTDTGLSITMSGKAPSSISFATFVESLRLNKQLTKQNVDSFSLDTKDGSVTYSITLDVKPEVVRYQQTAQKGGS